MSTYNLYKNKTYSLRLPNELQQKIKAIAEKENRKISQQYELIIRNWINDYEAIHGKIEIKEDTVEESTGGKTVNIGRDNKGTINM